MGSENHFNVVDLPSLIWPSDVSIPTKRFRLFVAADTNTSTVDAVSAFAYAALEKGMVYFCGRGPDCERFHDIIDEVILEDDLGARRFVGPDDSAFVMTTWHANDKLDEALDFFAIFAHPPGSFEPGSDYWLAISVGNAEWAASIHRILGRAEFL
jgi:hypothetical protein